MKSLGRSVFSVTQDPLNVSPETQAAPCVRLIALYNAREVPRSAQRAARNPYRPEAAAQRTTPSRCDGHAALVPLNDAEKIYILR